MSVRLFVDNLPPAITEEELDRMFSMYGRVEFIYVAGEWETPAATRFGFVDMERPRDAEAAIAALQDAILGGKKIRVMLSRPEAKLAS